MSRSCLRCAKVILQLLNAFRRFLAEVFDSDPSDNSIAGKLQFALVFVLGVYALVPWMPNFMRTDDGDAAFTYSWHYLFANDDRFDSAQFLWPGPWAHAFYHAYHPGTYW